MATLERDKFTLPADTAQSLEWQPFYSELKLPAAARKYHDDTTAEINALASAEDEHGARKIFTVNCTKATALKIRRVKFHNELSVNQDPELHCRYIKFELKEEQSVPEAKQKQTDARAAGNIQAAGTTAHEGVQKRFEGVDGP